MNAFSIAWLVASVVLVGTGTYLRGRWLALSLLGAVTLLWEGIVLFPGIVVLLVILGAFAAVAGPVARSRRPQGPAPERAADDGHVPGGGA